MSDIEQIVTAFHTVRRYVYLSDGVRDPDVIEARRAGSCTGKHLVLRNRLRDMGFDAKVETVQGDFSAGIPPHSSMSPELREMIRGEPVMDFHNFVRVEFGGRSIVLDATWHDEVAAYGFSVNADWNGDGDTRIALVPERSLGFSEDVISLKESSLESLDDAMKSRRLKFLKMLSEWIAKV
ncbi:MAG: transglutaminase domain-containing protein [Alphaproteobacteria bacterium]